MLNTLVYKSYVYVLNLFIDPMSLYRYGNKLIKAVHVVIMNILPSSSLQMFLKLSPVISSVFNFCKDHDWFEEDKPDNHTLSYELLKTIMEDCLNRVSNPMVYLLH